MITVYEIKMILGMIEKNKKDPEVANKLEKELYECVLEAISCTNDFAPRKLAQEALKAKKIKFSRYCS